MNLKPIGVLAMLGSLTGLACARSAVDFKTFPDPVPDPKVEAGAAPQNIVIAGGCFWCTEGVFEQLPGVTDVVAGYAGGTEADANYEAVSTGKTRHAEAVKITYDPTKTSYGKLLKFFFAVAHDPTQLDRQGPDSGPQYRSAIFYETPEQKDIAERYIKQINESQVFSAPIVTTLEKLNGFYLAEHYHQDFTQRNPEHPYIQQQALPKIEKTKKALASEGIAPTTQPGK